MERRFEARLDEMIGQAEVSPELLNDLLPRLNQFVGPFVESLFEPEQKRHTLEYITGLVSGLECKTAEGIAYLHDQDRQGIQKFIGFVPWDHKPMLTTLAAQVGQELGEADGVIVFDPSAFPKKGTKSAGVGRQWCGRLGKVENCQVGIYMGYATRIDMRWSMCVFIFLKTGRRTERVARKLGYPRRSNFRLAINWRWRCWRSAAANCRTPGSRATMRWDAPAVFG